MSGYLPGTSGNWFETSQNSEKSSKLVKQPEMTWKMTSLGFWLVVETWSNILILLIPPLYGLSL